MGLEYMKSGRARNTVFEKALPVPAANRFTKLERLSMVLLIFPPLDDQQEIFPPRLTVENS
jgi:hypothetical protein